MEYKIEKHELCEHVVLVENNQEIIIGMLSYFGGGFLAYVKDYGQVSYGGFEVFDSDEKEKAIQCILTTYQEEIKNNK